MTTLNNLRVLMMFGVTVVTISLILRAIFFFVFPLSNTRHPPRATSTLTQDSKCKMFPTVVFPRYPRRPFRVGYTVSRFPVPETGNVTTLKIPPAIEIRDPNFSYVSRGGRKKTGL